jgi:hypothetical protein
LTPGIVWWLTGVKGRIVKRPPFAGGKIKTNRSLAEGMTATNRLAFAEDSMPMADSAPAVCLITGDMQNRDERRACFIWHGATCVNAAIVAA